MGPSCPQVQNGPHHLFPKIYPSLITLQSSLVPKLETPASFWNPPCPSAFPSPADSAPIYLSNHSFSPYLPPCAQLRPLLRAFEHKPPIHPHIIHLTHTPATPPPSPTHHPPTPPTLSSIHSSTHQSATHIYRGLQCAKPHAEHYDTKVT